MNIDKYPYMIDIYKKNSDKTEGEKTSERFKKILDDRKKQEREEALKSAPDNFTRTQLQLEDIVRKRKETTARAQDIQNIITGAKVADSVNVDNAKKAYAARASAAPQLPAPPRTSLTKTPANAPGVLSVISKTPKRELAGPPKPGPGALQKLKTGAEYVSASIGAGAVEGLAGLFDTIGANVAGWANALSSPQLMTPDEIEAFRKANGRMPTPAERMKKISDVSDAFEKGKQGYLLSGKTELDHSAKVKQTTEQDFTYAGGKHNAALDFLADAGYQMGRMAPTIYVSALTSAAGAPSVASNIAGAMSIYTTSDTAATKRAREEGATQGQAATYGKLSGIIEGIGEYTIGGLLGKGSGLIDSGLQKLGINVLKNVSNPVVKPILRYLSGMAGEGMEEVVQEILDVAAQKATYKKDAKFDLGEIAYAGALGAFMGAAGSLPSAISSTARGASAVKYTKGIIEAVNNARTEQDFANSAAYIKTQLQTNKNILAAVAADETIDTDTKELASAPYIWMNGELEKALGVMSSRQNEIIKDNKETAYNGTTPDDVSPAVDNLQSEGKTKEAIDTVVDAVKSNNEIKQEIAADETLKPDEKKEKIDNINEANKELSETASDIRNNRYTPKTEKPKTGLEENASEYDEYLDEPEATEPQPAEKPVKPEPVKAEPVKPEPVKAEAVKPEPVKPEPVKSEPVEPLPVAEEPVKPEPVKPEPVKTEAPIIEPEQPQSPLTKPETTDTIKVETEKPVIPAKPIGNGPLKKLALSLAKTDVAKRALGSTGAWQDENGDIWTSDGVIIIRVKGQPDPPIPTGTPSDTSSAEGVRRWLFKGVELVATGAELPAPDLAELKAYIKQQKAEIAALYQNPKDRPNVQWYFGGDRPLVNAEYLLSLLQAVQNPKIYYNPANLIGPVYITGENADAVLMPMHRDQPKPVKQAKPQKAEPKTTTPAPEQAEPPAQSEATQPKPKQPELQQTEPTVQGDKKYNLNIVSEKHTKTGEDLIVARVDKHLNNEEYKELKKLMTEAGAYYSQVKKGFILKDPADKAKLSKFANVLSDSTETAAPVETTAPVEAAAVRGNETTDSKTAETEQTKPDSQGNDYSGRANSAAEVFADKLSKGETITRSEANQEVGKAFDGVLANNDFTVKDVNDAVELGVNKHILAMDTASPDYSVDGMVRLASQLPTQTNRTAEQEAFQQFSTPPALAFVVADTANIAKSDTVLEPSAGVGGIAVFAKKTGAKVYVNELDKRRLSLIKQLPFDGFYNEDAEQIHNILGDKIKPTVVVMNPPFSSAAGRNVKDGHIGAKHIEAALDILADGGRLVAVTGRGMNDTAPMFSKWWGDIKGKYNVRANIGLDGKNYAKYGTSFDVQLIVIDKTGATTGEVLTGTVETVQELQERLRGVKDERTLLREQHGANEIGQEVQRDADKPKSAEVHVGGENTVRPAVHVSEPTDEMGAGSRVDRPEQSDSEAVDRGDGGTVLRGDTTEPTTREPSDGRGRGGGDSGAGGSGDAGRLDSGSGESVANVGEPTSEDVERLKTPELETTSDKRTVKPKTELTDSLYDDYVPHKLPIKGAIPHPTKVAESAAMAAVEAPDLTYVPSLSKEIVDKGILSDVQLEAVSYAGQAHSQTLPDDSTRGFFIGDGTGLGKGREIAGIILDNFNRGRKKALWISENKGLLPDAKRDVKALFGTDDSVFMYEGGKKAQKILSRPDGVMFGTYGTIANEFQKNAVNLNNIAKWLGEDFDGVIIFDESHNMANAGGELTARGIKKASNRAIAGIELQKRLPKAKIVYSSATGATEVSNLRYAERLGLWGVGTPFVSGNDFVSKINRSGIAAMEVVARSLKAMGVYVSRNLSYDNVEYSRATHSLTKEQKQVYNDLAKAWQVIVQNIRQALEFTNGELGSAYSAFWGAHQRFFNQIITSMQVPTLIENIEKDLADGKSALIQLTSTNEAHSKRELAAIQEREGSLDEFDATPKGMVISYLENSFPVTQYETVTDESGNEIKRPVVDSNGNKVLNKKAVAIRDKLIESLSASLYPDSPIDMIINHFGAEMVAENTGRSFRMVKNAEGHIVMQKLPADKSADVDAYQNGRKRIIIFSEAGGTGKSYHADRNAKNQQRRRHYLLQPGWKADVAVQGFGRSHRSNQAISPEFILMTTDLPGQKRFVSTIARRLDQLGALTKGQAQAGSQGLFQASDNLENPLVGAVLENLYRVLAVKNPKALEDMGVASSITNKNGQVVNSPDLRDVNKFLNRVLMLDFNTQTEVFGEFERMIDSATQAAIEAGVYQQGLANHKADRVVMVSSQEAASAGRNNGASYYHLKSYSKLEPLEYKYVEHYSAEYKGIYQSAKTGKVYAMFDAPDSTDKFGTVSKMYRAVGPDDSRKTIAAQTVDNGKYYTHLDKAQEKTAWDEAIKKLPAETETDMHVIGGEILSIWDRLPEENVKISRFLIDNGEQIIGRVIDSGQIAGTLKRIGITSEKSAITPEKALYALEHGGTVKLVNGWELSPVRVSGETRFELNAASLRGVSQYHIVELIRQYGLFSEKINWQTRLFVPSGEKALATLEQITKYSPAESVEYKDADADTTGAYGLKGVKYALFDDASNESGQDIDGLVSFAATHGVKVEQDADLAGTGVPAYYNSVTGTIHINPEAKSPTVTLGHELFHALPEAERRKLIHFFRKNSDLNSEQFAAYRNEREAVYRERYAKEGRTFTEADFWQEFGAENAATIFTNDEFVEKLAKTDRSLARRILDWIRNLWRRITGFGSYTNSRATEAANISARALAKAEQMLSKALNSKSWNLSGETVTATTDEANSDAVGYGENYGAMYSLGSGSQPPAQVETTPPVTASERSNAELDALFEADRVKPSAGSNAKGFFEGVARLTRTIADIPEHGSEGTRFAQLRKDMIDFKYHAARSSDKATELMNSMMEYPTVEKGKIKTKSLTNDEYKVYEKAVYYRDLKEEAEYQLAHGKDKILLPHGMTLSEVLKQLDALDITDNVQTALENRAEVWRKVTSEYIEANANVGFDVAERFTRRDYYRHQVIEYMGDEANARQLALEINDNRGFLKARGGSEKAINTNYISVEYMTLRQLLYDTYVAKTDGSIKENYDIKPQLMERAKGMNKQAIQDIIIGEATQAAIKAEEERLKRKLTPDEIENIEPLFTTSKSGRISYDSETGRDIAKFNQKIAWAISELRALADNGALNSLSGEENFDYAIDDLRRGELNSDVFRLISELTTSENEQARIAALTFLKNSSAKQQYIKNRLGDSFMTWEKLIEGEDYAVVQPRRGNHFFTKDMVANEDLTEIIAAAALDMAKTGEAMGGEAAKLIAQYTEHIKMMGQPYEQWVVPTLVKTVMDKAALQKRPNMFAKWYSKNVIGFWKWSVTAGNPLQTVKYGVRNFIGDLDAAFAGNPGILKHTGRAVTDIWNAMVKNNKSPEYTAWADMGGQINTEFVQEITGTQEKKLFSSLKTSTNALDVLTFIPRSYFKGINGAHNFREAILRYSAYLYYLDKIDSAGGKVTDFVASNRDIVRGLNTNESKAYQLSNDLLGNYTEISEAGRWIRSHIIPFWSFNEANIKRYYRMLVNPIVSMFHGEEIDKNVARLLFRFARGAAMSLILWLFNRVLNSENDDKLPEDVKARPHLTLWSSGGNVIAFTRIGNIPEVLEWIGLDDGFDWSEDKYASIDKLYSSLRPELKALIELPTGLSRYPEFFDPKVIRDKGYYITDIFGLGSLYNEATGKPTKGSPLDIIKKSFVYQYDEKETAYWDTINAKYNFADKDSRNIYFPDDKSKALHYMKQAMRYGEKDKALRFMNDYFKAGGTGNGLEKSMQRLDPMYGYKDADKKGEWQEFKDSLDDVGYDKLNLAFEYYKEYLKLPESMVTVLRRLKDTPTDTAKARQILTNYINRMANKAS